MIQNDLGKLDSISKEREFLTDLNKNDKFYDDIISELTYLICFSIFIRQLDFYTKSLEYEVLYYSLKIVDLSFAFLAIGF